MPMHTYMYGYHWVWMIIRVLFWVLIIAGIFLIIRASIGTKPGGEKKAIDILKERYAKGEITREEYLEKKKEIIGD